MVAEYEKSFSFSKFDDLVAEYEYYLPIADWFCLLYCLDALYESWLLP